MLKVDGVFCGGCKGLDGGITLHIVTNKVSVLNYVRMSKLVFVHYFRLQELTMHMVHVYI